MKGITSLYIALWKNQEKELVLSEHDKQCMELYLRTNNMNLLLQPSFTVC